MEKQQLEDKELENILEKLEKIDIHEWNCDEGGLIVEKHGLKFTLKSYQLHIQNIDKALYSKVYDYCYEKKHLKKVFEGFYDRIHDRLTEHQEKELEEKLNNFLKE